MIKWVEKAQNTLNAHLGPWRGAKSARHIVFDPRLGFPTPKLVKNGFDSEIHADLCILKSISTSIHQKERWSFCNYAQNRAQNGFLL